MAPGSLPRDVGVQVTLITVLGALGTASGALVAHRLRPRSSVVGLRIAAGLLSIYAVAVVGNTMWQKILCRALDMLDAGFGWACACLAPPLTAGAAMAPPRAAIIGVVTVAPTVRQWSSPYRPDRDGSTRTRSAASSHDWAAT